MEDIWQEWLKLKGEMSQRAFARKMVEEGKANSEKRVRLFLHKKSKQMIELDAGINNEAGLEELIERANNIPGAVRTKVWQAGDGYRQSVEVKLGSATPDLDILFADLRAEFIEFTPQLPRSSYTPEQDLLLEISIPDLHYGKVGQGYNRQIAVDRWFNALGDIMLRSPRCEQVLLVLGNDLFHVDTLNNTTTAGTPQDTEGGIRDHFREVRAMLKEGISHILEYTPEVHLLFLPGNHDQLTTYFLGEALTDYYHNTPQVTIDNTPRYRKYFGWGQVMLGFAHGDNVKMDSFGILMATDAPEMWGRTRYREYHLGHFHRKQEIKYMGLTEDRGVRVRVLPSLSGSDEWHEKNGFVNNVAGAEGYVWEKARGLRQVLVSQV